MFLLIDHIKLKHDHFDAIDLKNRNKELMFFFYFRSICAHFSAANLFTIDFLREPENRALIERAQYFYISVGYFIGNFLT